MNLVMTAHRHLDATVFVDWDIAITWHGPVIIECNKSPDIEIEQCLSGPWGNERFGQLLAYHFRAAAANADASRPSLLPQAAAKTVPVDVEHSTFAG